MHALYYTHCNIALSAFGWGPARPTLSPPSPTPAGLFRRVDHLMRGEEARPMVVPPLAASARVAAQLNALRLRYLAVLVGFNGAQWWRRACPFAPNAARQRRPAVWRGPGAPAPFARAGPGLHVAMRATSVAQRAGLQRPRDPGQAAFRRICPTDGPAELLGLRNFFPTSASDFLNPRTVVGCQTAVPSTVALRRPLLGAPLEPRGRPPHCRELSSRRSQWLRWLVTPADRLAVLLVGDFGAKSARCVLTEVT